MMLPLMGTMGAAVGREVVGWAVGSMETVGLPVGIMVGETGASVCPEIGERVVGAPVTGARVGVLVDGDAVGWGFVGLPVGRSGQGNSMMSPNAE